MYDIVKSVILSKDYELKDMLKKINTIWVQGDLTDEQYNELLELARTNADTTHSVDVMKKLNDLEKRVSMLEHKLETEPGEEYPEYVPGKWYYKDDKITFNEKHYICTAPDGVVCTWNPDEYPNYWKLVE